MRGDSDELSPDEIEEVVLVPAQRVGEEVVAMPRAPIPRSLTLPRLPTGPVAGSFYGRDEDGRDEDGRNDED